MDNSVDDDDLGIPQGVERLERIALDDLDVGQLPGLDGPHLVRLPKDGRPIRDKNFFFLFMTISAQFHQNKKAVR